MLNLEVWLNHQITRTVEPGSLYSNSTSPGTRLAHWCWPGRKCSFPPALPITGRDKRSTGDRLMVIFPPPCPPLLNPQVHLRSWLLKLWDRISGLTHTSWENRAMFYRPALFKTSQRCLSQLQFHSWHHLDHVYVSRENCWHLTHIWWRPDKTVQDYSLASVPFQTSFTAPLHLLAYKETLFLAMQNLTFSFKGVPPFASIKNETGGIFDSKIIHWGLNKAWKWIHSAAWMRTDTPSVICDPCCHHIT